MEKDTAATAAARVCRRCKGNYSPSDNTPQSCRYYELKDGDPPYVARFYDCCGAEDPDAAGCATASHLSYDDPE
jgi:hypothetical protein